MTATPNLLLANAASTLTGFIFVVVFTRSAVTELIQRHQATILLDELNATHARLQTYVGQVEGLTVARERNRMARDIHDTLGHYLTVINVQIETAQKLSARDPARGQAALATAKTLASECLAEVRRSVDALRPAALDGVALPEAIARLVDDLRRASGVTIHVEGQGVGTLAPAAEETVYRVIQEALTNVRKHARAHNVWLRTEWGPAWFVCSVRDDGHGAAPQSGDDAAGAAPGFGLRGMHERVAAVGGALEITTAPGAGFGVSLRVPCALTASEARAEQRHTAEARVR
jgi:signal transduction histidine kinase